VSRRQKQLSAPIGELVGPESLKLMTFVCPACGRKLKALPSAALWCRCGKPMKREDAAC
jgi:hypothetical protein